MKLNYIDHICLIVSDIEQARIYYSDIFQFECKINPTDKKVLMLESKNVHFFMKEEDGFPLLRKQHLSFNVDSLDEIIGLLKEKEIIFEYGIFNKFNFNNYRWIEWKDPDGIRLECVEKI